ncbi:MAG: phenylalanine--tRNA ligase subunit alpha, partial [Thermodesulfovibrionales bacterium]
MEDLQSLKESFRQQLDEAGDAARVNDLRIQYLGRKGMLTEQLKSLGSLPPDERPEAGRQLNELKLFVEREIDSKLAGFQSEDLAKKLQKDAIDVTLPGAAEEIGGRHPLSVVLDEVIDIFVAMGFGVEEGPEVELDYYNFEALNIPKNHPARDMQDTFYVSDEVVLRTHTSPVQVRVMERHTPPLRFIAPGKVYRHDADVSHTPMFHQVEGLMVDRKVTFANLKSVLESFLHSFFDPATPVRFRPSYFPFTEPSAEVDIGCIFCSGAGCRVCKMTGWLEILGSGMVNPKVFQMAGYKSNRYTGFAFGMG